MIQFQEEEFLSKFKQFNEDILYITIGSVISLGLFGWLSTLIFSIEPCPLNHYERDELCFDCMAPLDNCAICSLEKICDVCDDSFYLDNLIVGGESKSHCSECKSLHGPLSVTCDIDQSFSCEVIGGKSISLYNGVCYDCAEFDENSNECDDKGPTSCVPGFYL